MAIELVARRELSIALREAQAEAVAFEPWDHVQVHVKNLLPGLLAVRQEQIDAFNLQLGLTKRAGETMGHGKHCLARFRPEIRQIR